MTADRLRTRASSASPQSWNRYSYVSNDPINFHDPSGLCSVFVAGITMSANDSQKFANLTMSLGSYAAYSYSGSEVLSSVGQVGVQAFGSNNATQIALTGIQTALATNPGSIDIVAYSGGASAFTAAYGQLSQAEQQRIGSVLYISPGAFGGIAGVVNVS